MIINSYSCTESILNPEGRFRTLEGVRAVVKANGMPESHSHAGVVTFNVVYANKPYHLKCFLDHNSTIASRANLISAFTSQRRSKYLTLYRYIPEEMLVFGTSERHHYCDIVLQEAPRGKRLDHFISEYCDKKDLKTLDTLFINLLGLVKWMHENKFSHKNFTPRNIIIDEDLEPRLINYETAEITDSPDDHIKIARLFIVLMVGTCQPEYLVDTTTRYPLYDDVAPTLVKHIAMLNTEQELYPLKNLARLVADKNNALRDWNYLYSHLHQLHALANKSYSSLNNVWKRVTFEKSTPEHISGYDDSHFSYVGDLMDNMRRVGIEDKHWFLDIDDQMMAGPYDEAEDFEEGRACVMVNGLYGMIDRQGTFIVPIIFQEMSWDGDHNVAIANNGDKWAIINRCGENITPFIYDKMFNAKMGLIMARKGEKYGYLNTKGETIIEFIYDDAISFGGAGRTEVRLDGRTFWINLQGEEVETPQTPILVYPVTELMLHP